MKDSASILVVAPRNTGEPLLRYLKYKYLPFIVMTNNKQEEQHLRRLGVEHILMVDTVEHETWAVPETPIGKVFMFEKSLPLCCRYLQIVRNWTAQPIYVISERPSVRHIYKGLGADHVIYSRNGQIAFLVD